LTRSVFDLKQFWSEAFFDLKRSAWSNSGLKPFWPGAFGLEQFWPKALLAWSSFGLKHCHATSFCLCCDVGLLLRFLTLHAALLA